MSYPNAQRAAAMAYDACERLNPSNPELVAGWIEDLVLVAKDLVSECENPVPDELYRKVLRDQLKEVLVTMGISHGRSLSVKKAAALASELMEAVVRVIEYLDRLEGALIEVDADMKIGECEAPSSVAGELRALLAKMGISHER